MSVPTPPPPRSVAPWWAWPAALVLSAGLIAGAIVYQANRPAPGPVPPPPPADLKAKAAAYQQVVPATLRTMADDVEAGRTASINDAVDRLEKARKPVATAFGVALDEELQKHADASGVFTDRPGAARALREAVSGMGGTK